MKTAFLLFLYLLISSQPPIGETIVWGEQELDWTHYKKLADNSIPASALTSTVIHLSISIPEHSQVEVGVKALFRKQASWVKVPASSLLWHETGHFNIAELYARKLRKVITIEEFTEGNYEERIMMLYNKSNREMDLFHDMYDRETDHSRNVASQLRWQKRIEDELSSLAAFAHPLIIIKLK